MCVYDSILLYIILWMDIMDIMVFKNEVTNKIKYLNYY